MYLVLQILRNNNKLIKKFNIVYQSAVLVII